MWAFNRSKASQYEMTTMVGSKGQISFPFWDDHHVTLEIENEPIKKFEFEVPKYIQRMLFQQEKNKK